MVFDLESKICNENAIMVSNAGSITKKLTYEEIKTMSASINQFLFERIPEKQVCVGLQMSHNIYIPSLVISLQALQLPFIFLNKDLHEIEKLCIRLRVGWILSFSSSLIDAFIDYLPLNADILYLYKTGIPSGKFPDICYIIQTSGSTGEPKLVRVTNYCINSNIKSLSHIFKITHNDTIYFGTPLTFDPSIIELGLALHNGACLLISDDKLCPNIDLGVTMLQIVPSIFLQWTSAQIKSILQSKLRILAFGGEVFPDSVLTYERNESLRLFNLYGVTEMSCWASVAEVDNQDDISIGNPLADTIIEVRDHTGNAILYGEGEIFIGSNTRICLLDNENTPPKFRATGDLGLINHSKIQYTGRTNDVFKRFGHKLHLTTIENLIKTLTDLDNKCVWSKDQSKLLTFFLLENCDLKAKVLDKIRVKLLHGLPKECFPDFFDILAKFPITTHGKINRKALESIYSLEISKNLATNFDSFKLLLSKYLGNNPDDFENWSQSTFFENGGNSITAIQFLNELGSDSNTFMGLFFEKNLKICGDYLQSAGNSVLKRRQNSKFDSIEVEKRVKLEYCMDVEWSYDLKACVDATPLIFNHCSKTLIAVGSFSHILAILDEKGQIIVEYTLPNVIESTPCQSKCKNFLFITCFDGNVYSLFIDKTSIQWTYNTGDRIKSSPILCQNGEAVVCGSYDKYIHCINSKDGICIWKTNISESVTSALLLYNKHLYATTIVGSCVCLSEITGEILWQYKCNYPIFGSPSVIDDRIICANVQGQIICLSLNGEAKWTYECNAYVYSSITQFKDFVIFGTHNHNLYVLQTGESEAKAKCIINLGDKMSSRPNLCKLDEKDLIIIGVNEGDVFIVDFDGLIVGEIKLPGNVFSSVAVDQNRAYVGCRDNNIYCISIK